MLSLLIVLIVLCACIWAARAITQAFGIGDPLATVIQVVVVLLALIVVLGRLGIGSGISLLQ